jgi:hypothetical protein
MGSFRKIKLEISRAGSGYGQYIISALYKGQNISVRTTDSECYDYLNDGSNKEKHADAKRHAYNKVVDAYNNCI